jgi:hypothetical protein
VFVSHEELKALKRRASQERAEYVRHIVKAVLATIGVLLSGTVPGGFRAAQ